MNIPRRRVFFPALFVIMASPISNDAFLREKIVNFVAYLKALLYARLNNARYKEFETKINELRNIDTAHFIIHVTESMVPYKTAVPTYVSRMVAEHGLENKDFTTDELTKLCRYVECFIDVISQ